MGAQVTKQVERRKAISVEKKILYSLHEGSGADFPESTYRPADRKKMDVLEKMHINKIVWPGTHDSATNKDWYSRNHTAICSMPIFVHLSTACKRNPSYIIDIRVQEDRKVCHGVLLTYGIDVVIKDVKKFLLETESEIIILEIRTEFGHEDPPEFDKYLEGELGEFLIHQDDHVFEKTISELLPKRIICVWKPRKSPQATAGRQSILEQWGLENGVFGA